MDTDELTAREAVRDLVARYNANADTGRFREVAALFARDAVMVLPDRTLEGRAEIDAMFREVKERVGSAASTDGKQHLRHFTSTLQIDVDLPNRANSRCYFQVLMANGLDHWGRYIDEFTQQDGTWLFARREALVDGHSVGSVFTGEGL